MTITFKPGVRECAHCGVQFSPLSRRSTAKYCSRSCIWKATKGPEYNARISRQSAKKRGDIQRGRGCGNGYVKLNGRHAHRVIAEQILGRELQPGEIVHHIDGNKSNNAPNNLQVMTQGEHMREHGLGIPGMKLAWEPWKYRSRD